MREQIIERGEDPENYPILSSRPSLWPDLHWVWEAFMHLSASRQAGFNGPQPISMVEVLAYADFRGIQDQDDREELLHYVQFLDQIFIIEHHKNKPQTPQKK